jgi:aryl-alcohol dehydrogenase-like predicted oxidoreductase
MMIDFKRAVLGKTGIEVSRFGLSGTYRPGKETIHKALDAVINYFFCYGFDSQMTKTLAELSQTNRDKYVVATGAYNLIYGHQNLRKTLEKRLRQLKTDYIDIFLFLGVSKEAQFPEKLREELRALKSDGKIKAVGMSCHDRKFAGKLASNGELDVLMIRYNAAHRGAEQDIFPFLKDHIPGLVSYTATRWKYLIRRQGGWPKERLIPTASQCYRFVLSNPYVDVCMMAPSNMKHFDENMAALDQGPLSAEEMKLLKEYGDLIYSQKRWFM